MTDITYIATAQGWLYLAAILDVWSRRVIGWACGPTLHVSLVLAALAQATHNRRPGAGLIHHSDRGVQYACDEYQQALQRAGLVCSMSRKANCYDNAAMESFWSTLKTETGLDQTRPLNRRAAELIVFDYIETFYNPTRLHSSLGFLSPVVFENQTTKKDHKTA
jgi:transposase InsO family protein